MLSDPLLVVVSLAGLFDSLGIRYLVGGSLASSAYGIPRATNDVDLVADIHMADVDAFVQRLGTGYYVDVEAVRDAVRRRASFNVIHLTTMFKADIFIMKDELWACEEMVRARAESLGSLGSAVHVRFASPEDTLLHKLLWYKLGNEVSDRQWGDVLGVLKVQSTTLDHDYLNRWAKHLGILDLLLRAKEAACT